MGVVGLVGGAYLGGMLALKLDGDCGHDECGFTGLILGGALGEAVGLGTGVHLGGDNKGSMAGAIGTSMMVGFGGLLLASKTDGLLLPAVPVIQLVTAIMVDRQAAAKKSRRRQDADLRR